MNAVLERIEELGIVPVVKIESARHAVPLVRALQRGGLPVAEFTFRTAAAQDAIKAVCDAHPEVLVGAGTVLNPEQADKAVTAGARFIVSPGLNPRTVAWCVEHDVPVVPGVATATDIEAAMGHGLSVLKFFPSEALGGLAMLRALSAPLGGVRFVPTGGVKPENLVEYLAFDKVLAVGGSWLTKADVIAAEDFDRIAALTREALALMLGFSIGGVALRTGAQLPEAVASMLPIGGARKGKDAGVITVRTHNARRAAAFLERQGLAVDRSGLDETPARIALQEAVGDFRVEFAASG